MVGLSDTSVQRIWKAHGLKPHRARTFKLSRDPRFVEKLRRGERFHASGLLRASTLVPGLDPDEGGEVLGVELGDIGLD